MDANNLVGIRYALKNKYGLKVVTNTQVVIVSTIIKHPGLSVGMIARQMTMVSADGIYKSYRKLTKLGVIDKYGKLTFQASDMVSKTNGTRIAYPLVSFVKERTIPPTQYGWSHLAAYIATQPNPVGICEALKKVIDPTEQIEMLYEMQNGLAFCSIMAGDVSQWADMKGDYELIETSKLLLKKAGKKI